MNENQQPLDAPNQHPLPPDVRDAIDEDPNLAMAEMEDVWRLAGYAEQVEPVMAVDRARFDALKEGVHRAIEKEEPDPSQHLKKGPRTDREPVRKGHARISRRTAWGVLASLALLCTAWFLGARPLNHEAPLGGQYSVALADGSTVILNAGSTLRHARWFGQRSRKVSLEGEAYFDVAKGTTPFTVTTFNGEVQVLGTRFNVRAWPGDAQPETEVVLEEGRVQLEALAPVSTPIVLEPGQLSRIVGSDPQPSTPILVDPESRMAWRSGGIVFNDRPVGDVLDEVERRFGVSVQVRQASIRSDRITLFLEDVATADEALTVIASVRGYTLGGETPRFSLEVQ